MGRKTALITYLSLLFSAFVPVVQAADGSLVDQFVGSPLLVLVAVLIIDLIAFVYHKVRK